MCTSTCEYSSTISTFIWCIWVDIILTLVVCKFNVSSGICRRLGSGPLKDGGSHSGLTLAACELNLDCTCVVLFLWREGRGQSALCLNWSEHKCPEVWFVLPDFPLVSTTSQFLRPCMLRSLKFSAQPVMPFEFVLPETIKPGNIPVRLYSFGGSD